MLKWQYQGGNPKWESEEPPEWTCDDWQGGRCLAERYGDDAEEEAEQLQTVRFILREFYRTRNPTIRAWLIAELLTPSEPCPACGLYWFDGCTH